MNRTKTLPQSKLNPPTPKKCESCNQQFDSIKELINLSDKLNNMTMFLASDMNQVKLSILQGNNNVKDTIQASLSLIMAKLQVLEQKVDLISNK